MGEILKENEEFKRIVSELKKESDYYPQVLVKRYGSTLYSSTWVRINRNNAWYLVHCVESIMPTKTVTERHLLLRMMESVHKITYLYKVTGCFSNIDGSQQCESDRLVKLYNGLLKERGLE